MPNQNGAGNWIVKTLNGVGLMGILAAVAMGAIQWKNVSDLRVDLTSHSQRQEDRELKQAETDRRQDEVSAAYHQTQEDKQSVIDTQQDKTVQMYNEALIRIEGKMEAMKEKQDEMNAILRNRP
jgi:hypothetical protein